MKKIRFEVVSYHNGKEEYDSYGNIHLSYHKEIWKTLYIRSSRTRTYEIIVRHSDTTCKAIVHVRENIYQNLLK